jgi:SAM-dependent methyltransferase
VGVDLAPAKAAETLRATRSHNQRASVAAGDACRLPFRDGVFDATFCVAVLQYVGSLSDAIAEIARVTAPGRRVVIVEPDNAARYLFSSVPAGAVALEAAKRFFAAAADSPERATHPAVGPRVPSLLATCGVETVDVRMFPVTSVQLGVPADEVWLRRRARVEQAMTGGATNRVRDAAMVFLAALDAYRIEAAEANTAFVEIQNTMLFATVGQKPSARR